MAGVQQAFSIPDWAATGLSAGMQAIWLDSRCVPAYACLVSILDLAVTCINRCCLPSINKTDPVTRNNSDTNATPSYERAEGLMQSRGGVTIFAFNFARLICTVTLCILSVASIVLHNGASGETAWDLTFSALAELVLTASIAYAGILCILGLTVPSTNGRIYNTHAALVLLLVFGVFVYRDLYPLALIGGIPSDDDIPWLMYSRLALSTLTGVVLPALVPRRYIPVEPGHPAAEPNPEQTASLLSFMTFTFMEPVVMSAYRNSNLPYEKLPPLADYDRSEYLEKRSLEAMDPIVRRERGLKQRHLFFGLMQVFFWEYVFFGFNLLLDVLSRFMAPYALKRILQYVQYGDQGSNIRPWLWIAVLLVGGAFSTFFRHFYIFVAERVQVLAENILLQQIFRHALRLRTSEDLGENASAPAESIAEGSAVVDEGNPPLTLVGTENSTTNIAETTGAGSLEPLEGPAEKPATSLSVHLAGRINTLVGADIANILGARDFLVLFVMLPFQVIISTWFLFDILGWSAIVGMGFMVAMMPVPGLLATYVNEVQGVKMQKTEARIQAITESMSIIRMIKMFGWEGMTVQKIFDLRVSELSSVRMAKILQLFGAVVNNAMPILILIVTFSFHTLVMQRELDAATIFSSIAVLDLLRLDLGNVPYFITSVLQAKVSLDRLTKFLYESPVLDKFGKHEPLQRMSSLSPTDDATIGFKNVSLTWERPTQGEASPKRHFRLQADSLLFSPGRLNLVTGPTGCGKTSLLMGLLGELYVESTDPLSWVALPRKRGVAYAAQEPWVQNATIRDNITFLEPFEEERYRRVLHQCALERDLELLGAGDVTEVGEKGITLSGGQKARITLARAVYSQAEVILLDDVLSALDVHTSQWIVTKCLQGDLLADRTVIIATHAVDLVSPLASRIVRISRNGFATSTETFPLGLKAEMQADVTPKDDGVLSKQDNQEVDNDVVTGKLTVDEELETGRLRWAAIALLIIAYGGYGTWVAIIGAFLLAHVSTVIGTWWLGVWARAFETSPNGTVYVPLYLGIFGALGGLDALLYAVSYLAYMLGSLRASERLHHMLSEKVFGSTLRWLDITPVGRIVARFTGDMSTIDGPLAAYLQMFISFSLSMLIQFTAVLIFAPVFVLPGLLIAIIGIAMGQIYISARLPVRRLMSNWRSPLYTHFSASVDGLTSIRAYGAEDTFQRELFKRLDEYTRPSRTFNNLDRWIAVRADMLGAIFSASLAVYLVYHATED